MVKKLTEQQNDDQLLDLIIYAESLPFNEHNMAILETLQTEFNRRTK